MLVTRGITTCGVVDVQLRSGRAIAGSRLRARSAAEVRVAMCGWRNAAGTMKSAHRGVQGRAGWLLGRSLAEPDPHRTEESSPSLANRSGTRAGSMGVVHGFRPADESEVVVSFLRGEIDSERCGDDVRRALVDAGGLELVHSPDLDSEEENRARERALSVARGWRTNAGLFTGFPDTVTWYHGVLQPDDLSRVRFIDYSYWVALSGGSRRPSDVLPTLQAGTLPAWLTELGTSWCFELAARLATTEAVDGLIVMATPDLGELVLLEGHARLAAMFVGGLQRKLAAYVYLGLSVEIELWELF